MSFLIEALYHVIFMFKSMKRQGTPIVLSFMQNSIFDALCLATKISESTNGEG